MEYETCMNCGKKIPKMLYEIYNGNCKECFQDLEREVYAELDAEIAVNEGYK